MKTYSLIHKPINSSTALPQVQSVIRGEGKFIRQSGKHYGHVILQLEPNLNRNGCFMLWSVSEDSMLGEYSITEDYLEYVYEGLCEAITEKPENAWNSSKYVPFRHENTNVRIIGGSWHPVDSKISSFREAAYLALAHAVSQL
jgi:hypothetical protein